MQRKLEFLHLCLFFSFCFNLYLISFSSYHSTSPSPDIQSNHLGHLLKLETHSNVTNTAVFMFIAIGSGAEYANRRKEIRRTWLNWIESDAGKTHAYRFFTDHPRHLDRSSAQSLIEEQKLFGDLVFLDTPSGREGFGYRGMQIFDWAVTNFDFVHLLKTDDDSFPCLPVITNELLMYRPRKRFVWGKYWFRKGNSLHSGVGKNRLDENLLIMTSDIVRFIVDNQRLLVFDGRATFAVNFAFWSHFLNLTIFDDRDRIDSQQHYLTDYMHNPFDNDRWDDYASFCKDKIYAHHVYPGIMDAVFSSVNVQQFGTAPVVNITLPRRTGYSFDTRKFKANFPHCACSSLSTFLP